MTNYQFETADSEKYIEIDEGTIRKLYLKPYLEELGDLRDLTLGPSPGLEESGNPFVFKA